MKTSKPGSIPKDNTVMDVILKESLFYLYLLEDILDSLDASSMTL